MSGIESLYHGLVIVNSVSSETSLDDIADHVRANIDDWVGKPVLWELSAMDLEKVSTVQLKAFIRDIADTGRKRSDDRTAIVAPDDLRYGILRMFEANAEFAGMQIHFRTFRSLPEALTWLGGDQE